MIRIALPRALAVLVCALAPVLALPAADVPPSPLKPDAGMERGAWSLEPWGNSGSAETETIRAPAPPPGEIEKAARDRRLLKLTFNGGEKDKCAFKHLTCFGISPRGKLTLQVYAPEDDPPPLAVALVTTVLYKWHESKTAALKKGWNSLEFSPAAGEWKTEASKWAFSAAIDSPEEIRAVDLLIYNKQKTGVLYVEGLRYDPDEKGMEIAAVVKDLLSDDADLRESAEKKLVALGKPATEALQQLSESDRPEVMLRAASALRAIENIKEAPPPDPAVRAALEKQKEEQRFDALRRDAEYSLHALRAEKAKLLELMIGARKEMTQGRAELDQFKIVDVEKRKACAQTLDQIEALLKELEALALPGAARESPKPK